MTEVVAAAQEATTETQVSNEVVAEQSQTTTEQTQAEQVTEPDYSFVPKKFLVDGKPDWENFSKSYTNLEKKLGTKGAFAPEDIAEYEFVPSANVPFDEEAAVSFKAEAQKAGLSKEQYSFVMGKYQEMMTNLGVNPDASAEVLKAQWGSDFEKNLGYASKAFNEIAPSDISKDDPVLNNPTVLKLLAAFGRELGEDSQSNSGKASTSVSSMTEAEFAAFQSSPEYWTKEGQAKAALWFEKRSK